ncbi:MAG: hypothetical protein ACI819_001049 [Neolewinella sp.]|jgi:hypothetical protein|nr:hypothetical protein [Lewinella sp.]
MDIILNLLSADQISFIIATYGSVANWIVDQADMISITIEDIML